MKKMMGKFIAVILAIAMVVTTVQLTPVFAEEPATPIFDISGETTVYRTVYVPETAGGALFYTNVVDEEGNPAECSYTWYNSAFDAPILSGADHDHTSIPKNDLLDYHYFYCVAQNGAYTVTYFFAVEFTDGELNLGTNQALETGKYSFSPEVSTNYSFNFDEEYAEVEIYDEDGKQLEYSDYMNENRAYNYSVYMEANRTYLISVKTWMSEDIDLSISHDFVLEKNDLEGTYYDYGDYEKINVNRSVLENETKDITCGVSSKGSVSYKWYIQKDREVDDNGFPVVGEVLGNSEKLTIDHSYVQKHVICKVVNNENGRVVCSYVNIYDGYGLKDVSGEKDLQKYVCFDPEADKVLIPLEIVDETGTPTKDFLINAYLYDSENDYWTRASCKGTICSSASAFDEFTIKTEDTGYTMHDDFFIHVEITKNGSSIVEAEYNIILKEKKSNAFSVNGENPVASDGYYEFTADKTTNYRIEGVGSTFRIFDENGEIKQSNVSHSLGFYKFEKGKTYSFFFKKDNPEGAASCSIEYYHDNNLPRSEIVWIPNHSGRTLTAEADENVSYKWYGCLDYSKGGVRGINGELLSTGNSLTIDKDYLKYDSIRCVEEFEGSGQYETSYTLVGQRKPAKNLMLKDDETYARTVYYKDSDDTVTLSFDVVNSSGEAADCYYQWSYYNYNGSEYIILPGNTNTISVSTDAIRNGISEIEGMAYNDKDTIIVTFSLCKVNGTVSKGSNTVSNGIYEFIPDASTAYTYEIIGGDRCDVNLYDRDGNFIQKNDILDSSKKYFFDIYGLEDKTTLAIDYGIAFIGDNDFYFVPGDSMTISSGMVSEKTINYSWTDCSDTVPQPLGNSDTITINDSFFNKTLRCIATIDGARREEYYYINEGFKFDIDETYKNINVEGSQSGQILVVSTPLAEDPSINVSYKWLARPWDSEAADYEKVGENWYSYMATKTGMYKCEVTAEKNGYKSTQTVFFNVYDSEYEYRGMNEWFNMCDTQKYDEKYNAAKIALSVSPESGIDIPQEAISKMKFVWINGDTVIGTGPSINTKLKMGYNDICCRISDPSGSTHVCYAWIANTFNPIDENAGQYYFFDEGKHVIQTCMSCDYKDATYEATWTGNATCSNAKKASDGKNLAVTVDISNFKQNVPYSGVVATKVKHNNETENVEFRYTLYKEKVDGTIAEGNTQIKDDYDYGKYLFYSFTPSKSGNYIFSLKEEKGKYFEAYWIDESGKENELDTTKSFTVYLEANKKCYFKFWKYGKTTVKVTVAGTGWQKISNVWYYFNGSGVMQTGWQKISNVWYYFNGSGAMQTGWQKISNVWYYFNGSGAMQTGWQKISNKWYYFNGSGAMQTGWQKISNKWYYFNGSGAMLTGWQKIGGAWYYMNSSGAMQTGWITLNGKSYYLTDSGAMASNTWIGKYYVDGNGVWTKTR